MKDSIYEQSLNIIAKAAYDYYINEKSQSEIATEYELSNATISRLIKLAKHEGVIHFSLDPYLAECLNIEALLKEKTKLKEVIIAPAKIIDDDDEINKRVAIEGARYLQRILENTDVVGLCWGFTIQRLIHYLNPGQRICADFVSLTGHTNDLAQELNSEMLERGVSRALSGRHYPINVPAFARDAASCQWSFKEPSVAKAAEQFERTTISVSGLGSLYGLSLITTPFITMDEINSLRDCDVCGDIVLRFLDKNGKECNTTVKQRTVSIGFEQYKKIPTKIVVASGLHKKDAVLAALKGRLVDVLIIDQLLAAKVLEAL